MIDGHQHFWRVARGDYGWLEPEDRVLYRDFEPDHLQPLLEAADIEGTVLVQAAPTVAETRFLIEIARNAPFVRGVVGWVDFEAPDVRATLEALVQEGPLLGVRPMIQDISDPDWMLGDALEPAFEALLDLGLRFDALVLPHHLGNLRELLARHPELPVVVDHGAKPEIGAGRMQPWADDIEALARETGALCKLSGLATEAAPDWTVETLRPYVDHLLASFGPERLLWGSDWPVVELAGGFERWRAASLELLAGLDERERAGVLGGNAVRFYGIEGGSGS